MDYSGGMTRYSIMCLSILVARLLGVGYFLPMARYAFLYVLIPVTRLTLLRLSQLMTRSRMLSLLGNQTRFTLLVGLFSLALYTFQRVHYVLRNFSSTSRNSSGTMHRNASLGP